MRRGSSSPEVATIQIEVSYPVCFSSVTTRVKTARDPSGETCGSAIQTKLNRSFSVMDRLAAPGWGVESWATMGVTIARTIIVRVMKRGEKRNFMAILKRAFAALAGLELAYPELHAVE